MTIRQETCPMVLLNNMQIPQADHVKYLAIYLDKRLTWKKHIFIMRKQLGLQLHKIWIEYYIFFDISLFIL